MTIKYAASLSRWCPPSPGGNIFYGVSQVLRLLYIVYKYSAFAFAHLRRLDLDITIIHKLTPFQTSK